MGLIPKVKCSRCDKSYSGLKNKCPYCGASRGRSGKRVADTGDNAARFMIKMLLLLALVVTVISMLVIDFDSEPVSGTTLGTPPPVTNQGEGDEGGEMGEDGTIISSPVPTATPEPTPPAVEATSLGIRWQFWAEGVRDMTIPVGTIIELWAQVFPTDATSEPIWSTSASTVANFRVLPEDTRRIELEARSAGEATISVTVDGQESEIIVRVR